VRCCFLLLILALGTLANDWHGYSTPYPVLDAAAVSGGVWLATQGGLRFVADDGSSQIYSAKDGLEETSQAGVTIGPDGTIYAVSKKGLISRKLSTSSRFEVINRSFSEQNNSLRQGLALYANGYLILAFEKRLAIFDVQSKVSRLTFTQIGATIVEGVPIDQLQMHKDTLYILFADSSIYRRYLPLTDLNAERNLADPSSWEKLEYSTTAPLFAPEGKTISEATWADSLSTGSVWMGNASQLWHRQGGTTQEIPRWDSLPGTLVSTLAVKPDGSIMAWAWPELLWFNGSHWERRAYNQGMRDESTNRATEPLKTLAVDSNGNTFLGIWGGGVSTLRAWNSTISEAVHGILDPTTSCITPFDPSNSYTVIRGITHVEGARGVVAAYWGDSPSSGLSGLAYIDPNSLVVSCLPSVGASLASGPLVSLQDSSSGNWRIYNSYTAATTSSDGGLQIFETTNPESTQAFQLLSTTLIDTKDIGYPRDLAFDAVHQRLWMISNVGLAYLDANQTSVVQVTQLQGYNGGEFTALELDIHGNLWLGTRGQGAYMATALNGHPDTLVFTGYTSRQGLLSNTIFDIAISSKTGTVWFAHDIGLSSLSTPLVRDATLYQKNGALPVSVYPNPFRPGKHTQVIFEHLSEKAQLKVFDAGGSIVRSFEGSALTGGRLVWDGKNTQGAVLAPGLYHWVAALGNHSEHGRLLVIW